ncbi:MAG: hypothetical protein FJ202_10110 [Gemmatimonadetes bacterium]|nr:hypothetical protein [Gemmatimonadota bacterium]
MASLDGSAARLRYLLLHAMLPTPRERAVVPLPRVLAPLYVPIRLARIGSRLFRAAVGRR